MKILIVNAGSSSLKYQLVDMDGEKLMAKGLVERIGIEGSKLTQKVNGQEIVMGTPEQVAELIVYLCGCSNYMNGAVIPIDGGKHLL